MDTAEIQSRLDRMPAAMSAKGKKSPEATLLLKANETSTLLLQWKASPGEKGVYSDNIWHHVNGDDVAQMLENAENIIAALPSIEETRMAEFTALLAQTIELGNTHGIDVQFVNPLRTAMEELSHNALTHQRPAPGNDFEF